MPDGNAREDKYVEAVEYLSLYRHAKFQFDVGQRKSGYNRIGTDHVNPAHQSSLTLATILLHSSHSASQSRFRSSAAPYKFEPLNASSSRNVNCRGVRRLSGLGRVCRYAKWARTGGKVLDERDAECLTSNIIIIATLILNHP